MWLLDLTELALSAAVLITASTYHNYLAQVSIYLLPNLIGLFLKLSSSLLYCICKQVKPQSTLPVSYIAYNCRWIALVM